MTTPRTNVTAVFADPGQADRAAGQLWRAGFPADRILTAAGGAAPAGAVVTVQADSRADKAAALLRQAGGRHVQRVAR